MESRELKEKVEDFYQSHKKWVLIGGGVLCWVIIAAALLFSGGSDD